LPQFTISDFICTGLEEYYLKRLRTLIVNGRNDYFLKITKRVINISKDAIKKLPDNIFRVQLVSNNFFMK